MEIKAGSEVTTARPEVMSKMCVGRWNTSDPDYHLGLERPGLRWDGICMLVIPEPLLYVFTALDGARELLADLPYDYLPALDDPEETVLAGDESECVGDLVGDVDPPGFVVEYGFSYPHRTPPS